MHICVAFTFFLIWPLLHSFYLAHYFVSRPALVVLPTDSDLGVYPLFTNAILMLVCTDQPCDIFTEATPFASTVHSVPCTCTALARHAALRDSRYYLFALTTLTVFHPIVHRHMFRSD